MKTNQSREKLYRFIDRFRYCFYFCYRRMRLYSNTAHKCQTGHNAKYKSKRATVGMLIVFFVRENAEQYSTYCSPRVLDQDQSINHYQHIINLDQTKFLPFRKRLECCFESVSRLYRISYCQLNPKKKKIHNPKRLCFYEFFCLLLWFNR